jgi:hypothetical protein
MSLRWCTFSIGNPAILEGWNSHFREGEVLESKFHHEHPSIYPPGTHRRRSAKPHKEFWELCRLLGERRSHPPMSPVFCGTARWLSLSSRPSNDLIMSCFESRSSTSSIQDYRKPAFSGSWDKRFRAPPPPPAPHLQSAPVPQGQQPEARDAPTAVGLGLGPRSRGCVNSGSCLDSIACIRDLAGLQEKIHTFCVRKHVVSSGIQTFPVDAAQWPVTWCQVPLSTAHKTGGGVTAQDLIIIGTLLSKLISS